MDICRAPCADDHDGPEWFRITCEAREHRDHTGCKVYGIKEDEEMTITPKIEKMVALYNEGKTTKEIAEALEIPKGTVTSTIHALRQRGYGDLAEALPRSPAKAKIAKDALGSTQEGKKVESPAESPNLLPQPQDAPTFKAFGLEIEPANQEAPIQPQKDAPAMVREILPSVPVDAATIHSLIDMALRLPNLKKDLLHYADEVEAAGKYAISLAGQIRGAVGA